MKNLISRSIGTYLNLLGLVAPKLAAKHAFYVFCYPFSAKLRPDQQAFLDTSTARMIDFEGKLVAVYSWGQGEETILCLHGWQSNAFRWKKYIQELDLDRYTLLAVDAPGHGRSKGRILNIPIYARLIAKLMNEYSVDHILGHSVGCFAALYAMHEVTEQRPKTAVLIAAAASVEEFFGVFRAILGLSANVEKHLRVFFKSYTGQEVSYFETNRYVGTLDFPALIIHDRQDMEIPLRYAERLHSAWPTSELWITDGLGHKMRDISVVNRTKEFLEAENQSASIESPEHHSNPKVVV